MNVEVWHEHQVVGTHPPGSAGAVQLNGDLVVTHPDATSTTYPDGTWDAWGTTILCAYRTPSATCPRCVVQAQVTPLPGAA